MVVSLPPTDQQGIFPDDVLLSGVWCSNQQQCQSKTFAIRPSKLQRRSTQVQKHTGKEVASLQNLYLG